MTPTETRDWTWLFGGGPNGPLLVTMRHPGLLGERLHAYSWVYTPDARTNLIASLQAAAFEKGLPITAGQAHILRAELDDWLTVDAH